MTVDDHSNALASAGALSSEPPEPTDACAVPMIGRRREDVLRWLETQARAELEQLLAGRTACDDEGLDLLASFIDWDLAIGG